MSLMPWTMRTARSTDLQVFADRHPREMTPWTIWNTRIACPAPIRRFKVDHLGESQVAIFRLGVSRCPGLALPDLVREVHLYLILEVALAALAMVDLVVSLRRIR